MGGGREKGRLSLGLAGGYVLEFTLQWQILLCIFNQKYVTIYANMR